MERLKNKTAIITGGTKGIGKGIATVFALEGANITIVGKNEIIGKKTATEISNTVGKKVLYCKANITKSDELKSVVETTINTYGNLDILYFARSRMRNL